MPGPPEHLEHRRLSWVDVQLRGRGICDQRVLEAMENVPRELFVPDPLRDRAYADGALPLGFGQTISQPFVVAFTCEALALEGHERVLEIGTGSGYAAAVLEKLSAEVHTIERIPELARAARQTLTRSGCAGVSVYVGDGSLGLADRAPFGAIAVAAASATVPPPLWEQLAVGGRIAIPLACGRGRQRLCVFEREAHAARLVSSLPVRFVPLVSGSRW